jgi:hypothetical protein
MEALGRVFNVIHSASGVHIPLKDASAVTFFGFENDGATEIALIESKGAGVSETALTTVTRRCVDAGGARGDGDGDARGRGERLLAVHGRGV